jgi:osmotically-inducible protein OsmY
MRTLLLVALGLCILGCNSEDASDLKRDAGALAKTTGRVVSNGQLVARINLALSQTKGVDMSGLHIEATKGAVTVGGHVRNAEEKKRVIGIAESVRGVDRVIDQLRIKK